MRVILASNRGTLMELGISPIVTSVSKLPATHRRSKKKKKKKKKKFFFFFLLTIIVLRAGFGDAIVGRLENH
jgi:preprotein translocase subunit SecY